MLKIIVLSVLLVHLVAALPVSNEKAADTTDEVAVEEATTAAPLKPVEETSPEVVAEMTTTLAPPVPTETPTTTSKPRKVITFDQRQEGKYNIRADLENFVIVVVPSSPSSGLSLLDLLNRSAFKGQTKNHHHHSRKHNKNHEIHQKSSHVHPEVIVLDTPQSQARVGEEFIEGRTPYKVDISSSGRSDSHAPAMRLIKPFSFNVETPNRIVFPSSSGNFFDSSFRNSRSLPQQPQEVRSNTVYAVVTNNNGDGDSDDYSSLERQFIDLPNNSFDRLDYAHSDVDMMKLQLQGDNNRDDWELKLIGAQEQCGPERKRDSYGVCQFVTA